MHAACAARSPRRSSGVRTLRQMISKMPRLGTPASTSFTGGMMRPSSMSSVARGIEPGDAPPTSA